MQAHQLEILCKVVDHGSFSQAAAELFISQPAVSQHIKALETELGVRLLDRGAGEVALTEAGILVHRHARQMLGAQDEMRRNLEALQLGTRGRLAIGASATGVLYYLPLLLRRYMGAHPHASPVLHVDITDRLKDDVGDGQIDVALVWGPVNDPQFQAIPVHQARFVVVCSPDHPLARQTAVEPADLSNQPFVMYQSGTGTRHFIEAILRGAGISLRVAMEGPATEFIKKAVECNLGLALVSRRAVHQEVAQGTLCVLPTTGIQPSREITLIMPRRRTARPAVEQFVGFVLGAIGAFAEQDALFSAARAPG